ncbi:MAG: aldo/keto reductase [Armatimonadetes bacterium]|nr:aldo/keto reductase [Armatimonadota bacterium]
MKQRQLGPDGPLVGAIGLGGMPLSVKADRPSEADAVRLLTRAAELGMTLWDTADAYCLNDSETGHNERLFAAAFHALPSDLKSRVVLATKGGHIRPEGKWVTDGRPEHLRAALDASLKALNLETIPLYQFHRPDPKVPFGDSVGVLREALDAGKIQFAGLSNVSVAQIDEAMQIVPVVSVQNQFSPTHRAPEEDGVLEHCRKLGLAFLPWSPLGGMGGAKGIGAKGELTQIAHELSISPQRVVLAWHLAKYERSLPIPGASRLESVEDSAKGSDIELSSQQVARLDASFSH